MGLNKHRLVDEKETVGQLSIRAVAQYRQE